MRPWPLVPVLALLVVPAGAHAQARAPDDGARTPSRTGIPAPPGSVEYGVDPRPLEVSAFKVSPSRFVTGRPTTVRLRLGGGPRRARVRILLVREGATAPAATLKLGRRRTGVTIRRRWTPRGLPAGDYTARVHALPLGGRTLKAAPASRATSVEVRPVPKPPAAPAPAPAPAPALAPSGVFPVRGPWSFGGEGSGFGVDRGSHVHEGQDITAPEGTPLVSPVDGTVSWRAVQPKGAGHYLVIRDARGRDHVFMHLVAGSETVARGHRVRAGQLIARVGSTGRSSGAHLHFELWPDGWQAPGSRPVDPRPQLEAWAARG